MITNVGVVDAALRLIIGIALMSLDYGPFVSLLADLLGWAVLVVGIALTTTALLRHCPVYAWFETTSCAPYSQDEKR
jgi:hypothetical protein